MLPRVLLIATKDLIAQAAKPARILTGDELAGLVDPDVAAWIDVVAVDVTTEQGWDISPASMLALARRTRSALTVDGFDGVVLTTGVDTIEQTAYLVDLLAGGGVLTAARRRIDAPDTDGPANLTKAFAAAVNPALRGLGTLVSLDDAVYPVRRRPDPPPPPPGDPETEVALIKTYPGMEANLLFAAADAGARGIVLEGTGAGNVPASLLAAISDLTDWGITVVVASRDPAGTEPLDALTPEAGLASFVGAAGARGLPADLARVALMVALGAGSRAGALAWLDRLLDP
jgi:L-asparaginase